MSMMVTGQTVANSWVFPRHITFGNAVVAFGVCDSCRLGVDDDGAGDYVGAVRRADQGRWH